MTSKCRDNNTAIDTDVAIIARDLYTLHLEIQKISDEMYVRRLANDCRRAAELYASTANKSMYHTCDECGCKLVDDWVACTAGTKVMHLCKKCAAEDCRTCSYNAQLLI